jgi:hypothetical protein
MEPTNKQIARNELSELQMDMLKNWFEPLTLTELATRLGANIDVINQQIRSQKFRDAIAIKSQIVSFEAKRILQLGAVNCAKKLVELASRGDRQAIIEVLKATGTLTAENVVPSTVKIEVNLSSHTANDTIDSEFDIIDLEE